MNDNIIDLPHAETVEIAIAAAHDGARVWVHVDGKLCLRIYRIGALTIDDRRPGRVQAMERALHRVLLRCNENGGTIDGELVVEIAAALGEARR